MRIRAAGLAAWGRRARIRKRSPLDDGSAIAFLAMELVEGEDLALRLKRGSIPVDEALQITRQIAEALEAAHEKGIVHRDLKPANVKLTPEGQVKVLDFGLAKAYAGEAAGGSGPDLSQSPTLAHMGTQAGVILGTAAYMSPEQARGLRDPAHPSYAVGGGSEPGVAGMGEVSLARAGQAAAGRMTGSEAEANTEET